MFISLVTLSNAYNLLLPIFPRSCLWLKQNPLDVGNDIPYDCFLLGTL